MDWQGRPQRPRAVWGSPALPSFSSQVAGRDRALPDGGHHSRELQGRGRSQSLRLVTQRSWEPGTQLPSNSTCLREHHRYQVWPSGRGWRTPRGGQTRSPSNAHIPVTTGPCHAPVGKHTGACHSTHGVSTAATLWTARQQTAAQAGHQQVSESTGACQPRMLRKDKAATPATTRTGLHAWPRAMDTGTEIAGHRIPADEMPEPEEEGHRASPARGIGFLLG